MRSRPKHIALFGNFGSDNLGNEGSLKAMLDFVRHARPDAVVTCVCYGSARAQKEHRVDAVAITMAYPAARWFRKLDPLLGGVPFRFLDLLRALYLARRFDVILVPGTGILDDFSERWQAMPYDLFKWGICAKLFRRPFAFVSIGAGPIIHPISRWLMGAAARMARYRSYRDEASKKYMLGLGVGDESDRVYPDIAFGLPAPEPLLHPPQNGERTIGVGVMHYYGWDRQSGTRGQIHDTYESRMTEFIFWLVDQGYRVRLLMGAQSDQRSFDSIMRRAMEKYGDRAAALVIAEPADTLHDLMLQMMETDLVVATRFHNIVAALKVGKAAISIGYADKNEHLLAQAGLDRYSQHAEQLDVARLIDQFNELMAEKDRYIEQICAMTRRFQERLREQDKDLLERFL